MIKSNNKYNPKSKTCFSFPFHLGNNIGGKKILFTNMNTNIKCVCQRYKQVPVNW